MGTKEDENSANDLEHLLQRDGDSFLNDEARQAQTARERRLARKRRLQSLNTSTAEPPLVGTKLIELDRRELPKVEGGEESIKEEGFDMFSNSVSPLYLGKSPDAINTASLTGAENLRNVDRQQEWDDAEGYYKATIGELINLELLNSSSEIQFRVSGVIGKGVFSTVLKCTTESISTAIPLPPQLALKCIRCNETMTKAAHNEIRFLQRFNLNTGIIPLLLPTDRVPLDFKGHTVLVFPFMEYNLRDVLSKFGKGVGLSLTAVRSYFAQMLAAATHLQRHKIIHSDLKPDNILVSEDFSQISICDFGSAVDGNESSEMVTPYLVSRFYRAPEIILGLRPTYAIDLWSLAVTVAELFIGEVLFQGANNNDMLYAMMLHLGPISNRIIRQHLGQTKKFPIPAHFTQEVPPQFRRLSLDTVLLPLQAVYKIVSLQEFSLSLQSKLLKAKSAKDSRTSALKFYDLLQKCLAFDPSRRISLKDALQHVFFQRLKVKQAD